MPRILYEDLRNAYQEHGAEQACHDLREWFQQKKLRPEDFSIRLLFEHLVGREPGDGRRILDLMDPRRKSGGFGLLEAAGAVDMGAFSNITGQIIYSKILDSLQSPDLLWPELVEVVNTPFPDGEKIPGIGGIGDEAELVDEGQPYPEAGVNEEYVETVAPKKRGFRISVTKEITIFDRTGLLLKRCSDVGRWAGLKIEKEVLDLVTGQVNNYKRNGTATNTYLTSGAYVNTVASNALVDWTDLENSELTLVAITDPNTGEPVSLMPNTIIVPPALRRTAERILNATEIQHVDNRANATTYRTNGSANPYKGSLKVLSSQYVKLRTGSDTTWFHGDPKGSFAWMQNWDVTPEQMGSNSQLAFERDIVAQHKVSWRAVAQVLEPRKMTKNTA